MSCLEATPTSEQEETVNLIEILRLAVAEERAALAYRDAVVAAGGVNILHAENAVRSACDAVDKLLMTAAAGTLDADAAPRLSQGAEEVAAKKEDAETGMRYEISRRPVDGWWRLRVWDGDYEMMEGVFEPDDEGFGDAMEAGEAELAVRRGS